MSMLDHAAGCAWRLEALELQNSFDWKMALELCPNS